MLDQFKYRQTSPRRTKFRPLAIFIKQVLLGPRPLAPNPTITLCLHVRIVVAFSAASRPFERDYEPAPFFFSFVLDGNCVPYKTWRKYIRNARQYIEVSRGDQGPVKLLERISCKHFPGGILLSRQIIITSTHVNI